MFTIIRQTAAIRVKRLKIAARKTGFGNTPVSDRHRHFHHTKSTCVMGASAVFHYNPFSIS